MALAYVQFTVCGHFINPPATWAATFSLRGFNLVYAVFMCVPPVVWPTLTTDGYGIFNMYTH